MWLVGLVGSAFGHGVNPFQRRSVQNGVWASWDWRRRGSASQCGPCTHKETKDCEGLRGLYTQVDCSQHEAELEALDFQPLPRPCDLQGAFAPFVCTARQFTCRCGPSGWPLAGVGSFVVAKENSQLHALVLDIATLKEAGMLEYAQLERALEHKRFRTWQPTAVRITSSQMVWIPYGMICLPSTTNELASFMVIPWLSAELAEGATEDVWRYISSGIIAFGNKNETKSPWKVVLPAFRNFGSRLFVTT